MGWLRLTLALFLVAVVTLPLRWLRGPAHRLWDWKTELIARLARGAVKAVGHDLGIARRLTTFGELSPWMRSRVQLAPGELAGRAVEVHQPQNARGPTILYLHGGGYSICNPRTHRDLAAQVAWSAGCRTVVLDYRLAPEHPYPAALEDALAACQALRDQGVQELWLAGDSAGGGLVACTLVALRDRALPMPTGAVMLSPWVDLTERGLDPALDSELDYLNTAVLRRYAQAYLDRQAPQDPLVSPVGADLRGLPPMLIQAGGAETMRDQVVAFAERAQASGAQVELDVAEGMVHVYQSLSAVVPQGREALRRIGAFVRSRAAP